MASTASGATVISVKFSERQCLSVYLVADRLLSDCWTKACEFARNFNSPIIEIEHLLLGASHIRDAEPVLLCISDDVEALTRELSRICARRSFAPAPADNISYEPSQNLRVLLCEAAALAAKKSMPNLTLDLVIEGLDRAVVKPAIVDMLVKTRRAADETQVFLQIISEMRKDLSMLRGEVQQTHNALIVKSA